MRTWRKITWGKLEKKGEKDRTKRTEEKEKEWREESGRKMMEGKRERDGRVYYRDIPRDYPASALSDDRSQIDISPAGPVIARGCYHHDR